MAATGSIRVIKNIEFRGGLREWSNRYYFDGTLPPDPATWEIFADNVVDLEKALFVSDIGFTRVVGYGAASDVGVYTKDYTTAGTFTGSDLENTPPDVAALGKWTTAKRTSKNHPVYLYNYWHGALIHAATARDALLFAQFTAFNAYMQDWIDGITDGTVDHHRCGPDGTLALTGAVEEYVRHRDFPR